LDLCILVPEVVEFCEVLISHFFPSYVFSTKAAGIKGYGKERLKSDIG
jgi:hypothetical protein